MSYAGAQSAYAAMLAKVGGSQEKPPELTVKPPAVPELTNPVLVVFGATSWDEIGRAKGAPPEESPHLMGPHRLPVGLTNVKLAFIATGCTSAHCVALGADGSAYAWGRNDFGQLGLGDAWTRPGPTLVEALKGREIRSAATGKSHTLWIGAKGELLASGASKQGAVGPAASKKNDKELTPVIVSGLPAVGGVACGKDFNLVVDEEGQVWAFGWSEFGVLGNGSDGEYNKSDSSVKLSYDAHATPSRILKFTGKTMVHVACGAAHCVAVESDGKCYTWGSGGYGRLGHRDQQDKWVPTELPEMRAKEISCGSASTAAIGFPVLRNGTVCMGQPSVYLWGRVKAATQDPWMYPKTEDDLRGWQVNALSAGAAHTIVSADSSVIGWGSGCSSGELGFGVGGPKSSARPKKIDSLEGLKVAQVACGMAHSMLLAEDEPSILGELPEWTPAEFVPGGEEQPAKGKAKGKAAADKGMGKAAADKRKGAEPASSGAAKKGKKK